jgi:hypothetical protein
VSAYEWDAPKAEANERKHGVLFSTEAISVFDDSQAITILDEDSDPSEQRFITLGMSAKGRLIVVVYAYRSEHTIRIISAAGNITRGK